MRGADNSLTSKRKQQAMGLEKIYLLYTFPTEHTLMTLLFLLLSAQKLSSP
jgi:hypothetical protein